MTYLVTERCIDCKYTDCVEVCPVDCFYEGPNMLVIDPQQCIDCGACVASCPANAIERDIDMQTHEMQKWLRHNNKYSTLWPNITRKKSPPRGANEAIDRANKIEDFRE